MPDDERPLMGNLYGRRVTKFDHILVFYHQHKVLCLGMALFGFIIFSTLIFKSESTSLTHFEDNELSYPEISKEELDSAPKLDFIEVSSSGKKFKIFTRKYPANSKITVLLLHGMAFTSKTWEEVHTYEALQNADINSIGVDLPGFGQSEGPKMKENCDVFISDLIKSLQIDNVVLVSPSMSGKFANTYLLERNKEERKVVGWIPVAPVTTQTAAEFSTLDVKTLISYGENDSMGKRVSETVLNSIPNSQLYELKGGSHPCYRDNPTEWNERVVSFLNSF